MHRYEFHLLIPPEKYLDYYRGKVRQVIARSTTGQNVQFPASLLQRFITQDGIQGKFILVCDEKHKCVSLDRQE